jgi:hypothetical protein
MPRWGLALPGDRTKFFSPRATGAWPQVEWHEVKAILGCFIAPKAAEALAHEAVLFTVVSAARRAKKA